MDEAPRDTAYADMVACDDGFRGELVGRNRHVDGVTVFHVKQAHGYLSLSLIWQPHDDCEAFRVGAGTWREGKDYGEVTEMKGLWEVTGPLPGRVRLIERHRG